MAFATRLGLSGCEGDEGQGLRPWILLAAALEEHLLDSVIYNGDGGHGGLPLALVPAATVELSLQNGDERVRFNLPARPFPSDAARVKVEERIAEASEAMRVAVYAVQLCAPSDPIDSKPDDIFKPADNQVNFTPLRAVVTGRVETTC